MEICPSCYSSLHSEVTRCPYCGYEEGTPIENPVRHLDTKKILLQFTAVAGVMLISILFLDSLAGGALKFSSNCGQDETCLISGLAVCDVLTAKPHTYGINEVEIKGETNGMCLVEVTVAPLSGTTAEPTHKLCAFPHEELVDKSLKDLYLCKDHIEEGLDMDKNRIQGAFLPVEEQLKENP